MRYFLFFFVFCTVQLWAETFLPDRVEGTFALTARTTPTESCGGWTGSSAITEVHAILERSVDPKFTYYGEIQLPKWTYAGTFDKQGCSYFDDAGNEVIITPTHRPEIGSGILKLAIAWNQADNSFKFGYSFGYDWSDIFTTDHGIEVFSNTGGRKGSFMQGRATIEDSKVVFDLSGLSDVRPDYTRSETTTSLSGAWIGKPDFAVQALGLNPSIGGLDVSFAIKAPETIATTATFYWTRGGIKIGAPPCVSMPLPPGQSLESYHIEAATFGERPAEADSITVFLDEEDSIDESDESNNSKTIPLPDIKVKCEWLQSEMSEPVLPGDTRSVRITFSNEGPCSFEGSPAAAIFLSTETGVRDSSSLRLLQIDGLALALAPGETYSQNFPVVMVAGNTFPLDQFGKRTFIAALDEQGKFLELTKQNNEDHSEVFILGEVINVLTHGFNPTPPETLQNISPSLPNFSDIGLDDYLLAWSSFWDAWNAYANRLKTMDPLLQASVRNIVPHWNSSDGFWIGFVSLMAAKVTDAEVATYTQVGDLDLLPLLRAESVRFKRIAELNATVSAAEARLAAEAIVNENIVPIIAKDLSLSRHFQRIHLIGHSRGGAVNSGVSLLLNRLGRAPDRVTCLDGFSRDWPDDGSLIGDIDIVSAVAKKKFNFRATIPLNQWFLAASELKPYQWAMLNMAPFLSDSEFLSTVLAGLQDDKVRQALMMYDLRAPARLGFSNIELPGTDHLSITGTYFDSVSYAGDFYRDILIPSLASESTVAKKETAAVQNLADASSKIISDGSFEAIADWIAAGEDSDALSKLNPFARAALRSFVIPGRALASIWHYSGNVEVAREQGNTFVKLITTNLCSLSQAITLPDNPTLFSFDVLGGSNATDAVVAINWNGTNVIVRQMTDLMTNPHVHVPLSNLRGSGRLEIALSVPSATASEMWIDNLAVENNAPELKIARIEGALLIEVNTLSDVAIQVSTDLQSWTDYQTASSSNAVKVMPSSTAQFFRSR